MSGEKRLNFRELYRLRRLKLEAERQALLAQLKENWLKGALLELERKYEMLGKEAQVNITSGCITFQEVPNEPGRDAGTGAPGPAR